MLRSPPQVRRSARKPAALVEDLARDAASSLLSVGKESPAQESAAQYGGGGGVVSDGGKGDLREEATPRQGRDDKKIHKLDVNAYKPWGSRSRSSSDAGSDTAFCKGGPAKIMCGEPVRSSDLGVLCDKCDLWFHASCQNIPKAAYEALVQFKVLSWFCPDCKKSLKVSDASHLRSLEAKVDQIDKSMKDHMKLVAQSMKEQEKAVQDQTRILERSVKEIHSQKSTYADIVKGSCSEMVEKVSAKISSIPQGSSTEADPRNMTGIVKAFDDFVDKDRRKNNLVVHNLPEDVAGSVAERSERDTKLFQEVIKDSFKMNVAVAKSFRVGKSVENRERLLIVTLETPGVKQDVLRMAPQLRNSVKWSNIYITPDLTPAEREAARKVREELARRRKAGETNLTIRKGRVVTMGTVVLSAPRMEASYSGSSEPAAPGGCHPPKSSVNSDDDGQAAAQTAHSGTRVSSSPERQTSSQA